jgi:hypothetical protein
MERRNWGQNLTWLHISHGGLAALVGFDVQAKQPRQNQAGAAALAGLENRLAAEIDNRPSHWAKFPDQTLRPAREQAFNIGRLSGPELDRHLF